MITPTTRPPLGLFKFFWAKQFCNACSFLVGLLIAALNRIMAFRGRERDLERKRLSSIYPQIGHLNSSFIPHGPGLKFPPKGVNPAWEKIYTI